VTAASPVSTPARKCSGRADVRAEGFDRGNELERCPNAALGIVLLRDGRAPQRHHRVADELLDPAAVPLDHIPSRVEVAREELANLLGVAVLGERREADQVGEEHRDDPALGDRRVRRSRRGRGLEGGAERRAALRAEFRRGRGRGAAGAAGAGERASALATEFASGRVDRLARGAGDADGHQGIIAVAATRPMRTLTV
jgi:hypothetical protein